MYAALPKKSFLLLSLVGLVALLAGCADQAGFTKAIQVAVVAPPPPTQDQNGSTTGDTTGGTTTSGSTTSDGGATAGTTSGGTTTSDGGTTTSGGTTSGHGGGDDDGHGHGHSCDGDSDHGGHGGDNGGGNGHATGNDPDEPTPGEIAQCASATGVDVTNVHGNHGSESITITGNEAVILKVSGNHAHLDTLITGKSTLKGVCLVVSGNHGSMNVGLGVSVEKLFYLGSGNHSRGIVNVQEGAQIAGTPEVHLSGNHSTLLIGGDGTFSCPAGSLSGNHSVLNCDGH